MTIIEAIHESGRTEKGIEEAGRHSSDYVHPREGDALVQPILTDLLGSGYTGTIAINPHVASIGHEGDGTVPEGEFYRSILRYARACERVVEDARGAPPQ